MRLVLRMFTRLLLLVGLLGFGLWFAAPSAAAPQAQATTGCPAAHCLWLPFVHAPSPVVMKWPLRDWVHTNELYLDNELLAVGAEPIYDLRVEARLFDASGALVQTIPLTPTFAMTLPNVGNPLFARQPICCGATRGELVFRSWERSSPRRYVTLPVETLRWTLGRGFAVAVHNPNPVPVYDVRVAVHHTTSDLLTEQFAMIKPGETAVYDNPTSDDYWGFYFFTWAQGSLDP